MQFSWQSVPRDLLRALLSMMVHCIVDASSMTEMRMSDLLEMKSYTKLITKQAKQLETLRRKHEKVPVSHLICIYRHCDETLTVC